MKCPHCGVDSPEGAVDCPACGLIFEKWLKKISPAPAPAPAAAPVPGFLPVVVPPALAAYKYPAAGAALIALVYAFNFSSYLPVTEGWALVDKLIFPLSFATLAIHEAGHPLMGFFGNEFVMTAGGTLFQLAFPVAIFFHFLKRGDKAGCLFAVFWTGYSLVNISFYMADADVQALILITGKSGREGGLHDWNYLLGQLGLVKQCVNLARPVFFAGVWGMTFPLLAAGHWAWARFGPRK